MQEKKGYNMYLSEIKKFVDETLETHGDLNTEIISMAIDNDGLSDCCGMPIILHDICSACGEHCEKQDDFVEVEI